MSYDTNESNDYRSVLCVLGDLIDCLLIRDLIDPIYFYSDLFIPIYLFRFISINGWRKGPR